MTATPRPQTTPSNLNSVHGFAPILGGSTNLLKTLYILTAAAVGMAVLLSLLPAAGHDQLWFLLMGQRWLHGALLYGPTVFDSNPPLIVWLSAIPVFLGEHLHLPIPAIGKLLVVLAGAVSASLSLKCLRRIAPLSRVQITWLAFALVCIFAITPARDFGQRDHLTAILCLPYVLAAALDDRPLNRLNPRRSILLLRGAAGVLAAIGICLKPHQALIPVAVELTRMFQNAVISTAAHTGVPDERTCSLGWERSGETPVFRLTHRISSLLRPEPPILLLSGLAFLAAIHHFAPLYFSLALPTLRDTYWAIGHLTPFELLAEAPQLHLLGLIVFLLFAWTRRAPFRPAIALLLAAGVAATAAYYLQGTGWYYQQLPAISFFACALALELLHPPAFLRLPDSRWLPRATLALAVLALALTTHFTGYPFTADRAFAITSPDPAFFRDLPPGTPVAMITTSVDDSMMPVARYHLLWSQRTNNVWLLPAILRSENSLDPQGRPPKHIIPPDRLADLDHRQHAWMVEDLTRWQPELILVARCQSPEVHCQELEDRHDDLLAWFSRDPAFRQIWQHFRYLRTSGMYDAYTRN